MPIKAAFFQEGSNRIVAHKNIWIHKTILKIYSIQNSIRAVYKITESKINCILLQYLLKW